MPTFTKIGDFKKKTIFPICLMVMSSLMTACNQSESFSFESDDAEEYSYGFDEPIQIGTFIDLYAGHPYDQDLPDEVYGVIDEELEDIHPKDFQRLLDEGLNFALENLGEPRYLFAISRAAYFFDHPRTEELLKGAIKAGSLPASAYMGYYLFNEGFIEEGLTSMTYAWDSGFKDPILRSTIELANESVFDPSLFNRPEFILALYNQDIAVLKRAGIDGGHYIGAMQNVLWQSDILFLVDDPNILLDLSPAVSVKEGYLVRKAQNSWLGGVFLIAEQGVQDARRLAMLYENNPKDFRRVYNGMIAYSTGQ